MSVFDLRPYTPEDFAFVREMFYESLFVPPGAPPFPYRILDKPQLAKYLTNWGADPLDTALIATLAEQPVGAVWGRLLLPPNEGYGFVDIHSPEVGIAIRPPFRNRGLGARLLSEIEAAYIAKQIPSLALSTDRRNPAKRLYLRHGFRIVKEDGDSLTMWKSLNLQNAQ